MFRNPLVPSFFENIFGSHPAVGRFKLETYEPALDDEAFIKMLVDDINHAVRTIKIVEGEENIELYNDERVADAFKQAYSRGVKIQFVLKHALF
jgi:phosphatidylserine/phosphatidylglycerophosphate/cardiolipin synthase-like enzyme